ncbi:MAG: hypothetical protein RIC56_13200 [Pseudomonadales bacterium]
MLVHSPLTGPSFWSGVRDALWARGRPTYLGRLPPAERIHPPYWLTHAAGIAAGLPEDDEVVLVAHSGAGPLLPAIGRLARNRSPGARVTGYLFVDCDLPRDGCSRLDLFDDAAAAVALRERSVRGWMPTWTGEQLRALIADQDSRERFVAELPRTPLALYDEPIAVPDDWPDAACAYLRLSEHYPGALAQARRRAWPLRELAGHHLLPLCEPDRVAGAIDELVVAMATVR